MSQPYFGNRSRQKKTFVSTLVSDQEKRRQFISLGHGGKIIELNDQCGIKEMEESSTLYPIYATSSYGISRPNFGFSTIWRKLENNEYLDELLPNHEFGGNHAKI